MEGGIEELNKEDQQALKEYAEEVSKVVQSVSQEHKDIHAAISKCGRVVDKVSHVTYNIYIHVRMYNVCVIQCCFFSTLCKISMA